MFRDANFLGGEITRTASDSTLVNDGFNDVITSVQVTDNEIWTLFENVNFQGRSVTVAARGGPAGDGRYPNAAALGGRNDFFSSARRNV